MFDYYVVWIFSFLLFKHLKTPPKQNLVSLFCIADDLPSHVKENDMRVVVVVVGGYRLLFIVRFVLMMMQHL